jgi:hypothetical protein
MIQITYEDGTVVRLPDKGLPSLLHLAGNGVLDWMIDVFDSTTGPREETNEND